MSSSQRLKPLFKLIVSILSYPEAPLMVTYSIMSESITTVDPKAKIVFSSITNKMLIGYKLKVEVSYQIGETSFCFRIPLHDHESIQEINGFKMFTKLVYPPILRIHESFQFSDKDIIGRGSFSKVYKFNNYAVKVIEGERIKDIIENELKIGALLDGYGDFLYPQFYAKASDPGQKLKYALFLPY